MKIGFDHEKYLEEQSKYILERVNNYDKLYLEFGGKLFHQILSIIYQIFLLSLEYI